MRCLLPRNLLDHGFFSTESSNNKANNTHEDERICSFSWSGQRRIPSYLKKLVFSEDFMTTLRTIAMQEDEVNKVYSFLEEVRFLFRYIILLFG